MRQSRASPTWNPKRQQQGETRVICREAGGSATSAVLPPPAAGAGPGAGAELRAVPAGQARHRRRRRRSDGPGGSPAAEHTFIVCRDFISRIVSSNITIRRHYKYTSEPLVCGGQGS